jgi:hypothetical protein
VCCGRYGYFRNSPVIDWVTNQIQSSGHIISKWQRPLKRSITKLGILTQRPPARPQRDSRLNRKQFSRWFGAAGYFRRWLKYKHIGLLVCQLHPLDSVDVAAEVETRKG